MTLNRACEILRGMTRPDGGLFCSHNYAHWNAGAAMITLDGQFDADDLEAMAVWIRSITQLKGVDAKLTARKHAHKAWIRSVTQPEGVDHEGQEAHG